MTNYARLEMNVTVVSMGDGGLAVTVVFFGLPGMDEAVAFADMLTDELKMLLSQRGGIVLGETERMRKQ